LILRINLCIVEQDKGILLKYFCRRDVTNELVLFEKLFPQLQL